MAQVLLEAGKGTSTRDIFYKVRTGKFPQEHRHFPEFVLREQFSDESKALFKKREGAKEVYELLKSNKAVSVVMK